MFINSSVGFREKASFKAQREQKTSKIEEILPVLYYLAMTSDKDIEVKPSAENYKAYVKICQAENTEIDSVEKNLKLAKEAVAYVKDMKLTSSTAMEHKNPLMIYQPTDEYRQAVTDISYLNKIRQHKTIDEYIKITKERASAMGVGNCSDQAILAASYLIEQKNIKNVALIACTMKGQNPLNPQADDQHVFAVVGLDKDADLKNPQTWGDKAVVVDPWGNITDAVVSDDPGKSALNKLYVLFRTKYMTFDNYAKYIDPTQDRNTLYNWENYKRTELN